MGEGGGGGRGGATHHCGQSALLVERGLELLVGGEVGEGSGAVLLNLVIPRACEVHQGDAAALLDDRDLVHEQLGQVREQASHLSLHGV